MGEGGSGFVTACMYACMHFHVCIRWATAWACQTLQYDGPSGVRHEVLGEKRNQLGVGYADPRLSASDGENADVTHQQ